MRDESEQRQLAAMRMAVRRAKDWEPAAHERAAELHERAAEVQARLGHQDRADQARRFAALARGRILDAYAEQAAWEATLAAFDDRNAARTRPPRSRRAGDLSLVAARAGAFAPDQPGPGQPPCLMTVQLLPGPG
jgi:hypothetical protein